MPGRPSILIVDDDISIRKTLAGILNKKGFNPDTAGTAREALEKAGQRFFNLALLDLKLPDSEGIDLIIPLKKLHPDMEMIVATGFSSMETAVQAMNKGASAYITKPLDIDNVLLKIDDILKRQHLILENKRLLQETHHELEERKRVEVQRDATLAELKRRTEELGLLYKAGHQLGRTLDLQEIYQVLYDVVSGAMPCDSMILSSFDPKDNMIKCVNNWHEGTPLDVGRFPLIPLEPEGQGIQSRVIRSGEPLLIDDFVSEEKKVGTIYHVDDNGRLYDEIPPDSDRTRSAILVPIKLEGNVVGVVQVLSYKEKAYTVENLKLLEAISLQVAAASNNAILYQQAQSEITERQRAERDIQRRATQLETINAIIASAAAAPNLETLLETALNHTLLALDLDIGGIWVSDHFILRNVSNAISNELTNTFAFSRNEIKNTFVTEDWTQEKGELAGLIPIISKLDIRASIIAPVYIKEKLPSGISVSSSTPRIWEKEEIALVEAVGQQVGLAADRLHLLERIQEQAKQLQETINTVPEGVLLLDSNGRIMLANPVAQQCLQVFSDGGIGQVITHLGGRPIQELLLPPPPGKWHEINLAGPPQRIFELLARPVEVELDPTDYVIVLREVTSARAINQYTQQQERLAAVGQLAAGIAHDFNNIMAVIILYSQIVLRSPNLPPNLKDKLVTIAEQGKQASDLIQQILDFSRRSVLELKPLELLPLLKEITKMLKRTLPESIRIEFLAQDKEYTINADPTRMQQALMNLAVNARDAMPNGGKLTIQLDRILLDKEMILPVPDMESGEWIELIVSDTGSGISESALEHIFEPFFTTKSPGKGTGLGLAQVYGIVKQHNGHITVSSKEGVQTSFTIYMPALVIKKPVRELSALSDLARGKGETILVVEDNPATRQAVVESLTQFDFKVLKAENGQEALEIVDKEDNIALVLTDMVMPIMSGKDLAEKVLIRKPHLKVLFMSGYSDAAILHRGKLVNGTSLLTKPFTIDSLIRKIRELLDN